MTENLPEKKKSSEIATKKQNRNGFLEKVRSSKTNAPAVKQDNFVQKALEKNPRLVFAFDATASREPAWDVSKKITDALFKSLPGQLDVCLAVHGGSELHTWTEFSSDQNKFRDTAAQIMCRAGRTQLNKIMKRTLKNPGVNILLYIGDVFEESESDAMALAESLKIHSVKVIILQEGSDMASKKIFAKIAHITGGALLPFDLKSPNKLREIFEAVALLAAKGVKALEIASTPGAKLLIEGMKNS